MVLFLAQFNPMLAVIHLSADYGGRYNTNNYTTLHDRNYLSQIGVVYVDYGAIPPNISLAQQ